MWFDPAVVEAVRDLIPAWVGVIMVVLSYLGSIYFIGPALIAAYWYKRDRFAPILGGMIGCYALMSITKSYHTASRPAPGPPVNADHFPTALVPMYEHAAHISNTSFPSGHAMAVTILVGLLVIELDVSTFRRRLLAGLGVIAWVGFTRIGLAVHYPGDIVGGIGYALVFLALYYGARYLMTGENGIRASIDDATAAFGVALIFGLGAVFVTSGGVQSYTFAHGSRNSHIALGGALGAVLAWQFAPTVASAMKHSVVRPFAPTIGGVVIAGAWILTHLGGPTRALVVVSSALALAAVVLVPWVLYGDAQDQLSLSPLERLRRWYKQIATDR